jgi:hypothetical protein
MSRVDINVIDVRIRTMIKKELIKLLEHYKDEDVVVIPLHQSAMGARPSTAVIGVSGGFDHDNGKIFLQPWDRVATIENIQRYREHSELFEKLLYWYIKEKNNIEPKGSTKRILNMLLKDSEETEYYKDLEEQIKLLCNHRKPKEL